jgi:hypothetical protein
MLRDSGELPTGLAVLERDLLWLLDCDPATLSTDQRTVREYVARAIKENGYSSVVERLEHWP